MTAEAGGAGAPRATYRLQLGPDLDFSAAAGLCEYLAALGVTHVYCSPILEARAGSTHGYDVADPTRISTELGGEEGLQRLAAAAKAHGLRLLVDFVPNHMGTGPDNPDWEALLREGSTGPGGRVFDVDWSPALPGADNKVVLPVLGSPYGQALFAGELSVVDEGEEPRVAYHEHSFPLSATSRKALDRTAASSLTGTVGRPETWSRLHGLLEEQHYRLVHWRSGDALVNYRRFFAIDELAAVRVEDDEVFAHVHDTVLGLVHAGVVDGLRLDHIDGLTDPTAYLERLRAEVGTDAWILVEKILAPDETLPPWPVAGTTGYDFLADVTALYVDPAGEPVLTEVAQTFDAWPQDVHGWAATAKREVLEADLEADTERLVDRLWALTQEDLEVRDVTRSACRDALLAVIVAFGVYRVYTRAGAPASTEDRRWIARALDDARAATAGVPDGLWSLLDRLLQGEAGESPIAAEALRRFHQIASAAMAKGVEDTLLYRQHRLAALNEVGVEPDRFGGDVASFHAANTGRAGAHPDGMLTTSTHDTKRGEDVRLRIAALSECAERWRETAGRWLQAHAPGVRATAAGPAPDPAMRYLCYQTLVGVWRPGATDLDDLPDRVIAYLVKAAREDGRRTSWTDPVADYEEGLAEFVRHLLDNASSGDFLTELSAITARTSEIAMSASLSQTLLRTTCPGAPDTYQGLELWGDNLVDPDNRRPVDFALRRRLLHELDADPPDPAELLAARADGRIKLWVLSRALRTRRAHPSCFAPSSRYVPLTVRGRFADRVAGFARVGSDGKAVVTIAPRLVGPLVGDPPGPPVGEVWEDTAVVLDDDLAGQAWSDPLTGGGVGAGGELALADLLAALPVALLVPAAHTSA